MKEIMDAFNERGNKPGLEKKYFVLNPNKRDAYGKASRAAMRAYADAIEEENHALFSDLTVWVLNIEREIERCKR